MVLAIVAGFIAWFCIGAVGFALMRAFWPEYAQAEPEMAFTFPMQLARLTVSVARSVGGGWLAALVAKGDSRPAWYHLSFLLTLAPIVGFSSRLASTARVAA